MRFSIVSSVVLGFAPAALAASSGSITSMMPMPTPSAGPVTMAWNDAPSTTSKSMASQASEMNSAMQSGSMSMMKSGMTMSGGMAMSTGSAMGQMSNSTGSAGRLEKTKGMVVVGLLLALV